MYEPPFNFDHMKKIIVLLLTFYLATSSVFSQTNNVPDLALAGARIYQSPFAAPIENGIVLIRNGKIIAVGSSDKSLCQNPFGSYPAKA